MPRKYTARKSTQSPRREKMTIRRVGRLAREGVKELSRGKGAAQLKKDVIAVGLSKARKAGIPVNKLARAKGLVSKRGRSGIFSAIKKRVSGTSQRRVSSR